MLQEHLEDAYKNSPPDSVYALDLTELRKNQTSIFGVFGKRRVLLLGCGALKELDKTHGEIKSMRTTKAALKRGVGSLVVAHIIEQAKAHAAMRG